MHHHRVCPEHLHPFHDVTAVLPPHLDGVALTLATRVQLRHHDVIAQRALIDACQPQELDSTVAPAMQHHGRLPHAFVDIQRVVPLARCHHHERVAQGIDASQAVHPLPTFRILRQQLLVARIHVPPVRIRCQRIVQHIDAGAHNGHHRCRHDNSHQHQPLSLSHAAKLQLFCKICKFRLFEETGRQEDRVTGGREGYFYFLVKSG